MSIHRLTPTYILRYLEKKLGYKFKELELNPDEIMENIREETLVTFSAKFPYFTKVTINPDTDVVEKTNEVYTSFEDGYQNNIYYINTPLDIIGVSRIYQSDFIMADADILSNFGMVTDPFERQELADVSSMIRNPITWEFLHPNMVRIFPVAWKFVDTILEIKCVHPDDFHTIPINMQQEFLKLALIDTKEVLYQMRHVFSNIQTAYGSIEMFIDDLQNATQERKDLLEYWKINYAKSSKRKKLYIY